MTAQQQVEHLQSRVQHWYRTAMKYRDVLEQGHIATTEEVEALAAIAKGIATANSQLESLLVIQQRAKEAAPNN